jgi:hypothetical protein
MNPPTFAIVGAVNHGKSSVVATLAEDDRVPISDIPGETVECQRFRLRDLVVFFDTPGFQNAREMLAEIREPAERSSSPLDVFRAFAERYGKDPDFAAECRLLEPILAGACILYVVDGSREFIGQHRAEMEILRLTGRPRVALINSTGEPTHLAEWQSRLGQQFSAVREFNAHRATWIERVELIETLASLDAGWKPALLAAASRLREEGNRRLDDAAQTLVELLGDALTHTESAFLDPEEASRREEIARELSAHFQAAIAKHELRAHIRLIELFDHGLVNAGASAAGFFAENLSSEETWRFLGMPWWVLATGGAATGAVLGAKGGAAAGAHMEVAMPSGIPTVVGTGVGGIGGMIAGGAGAVFLGKRMATPRVRFKARDAGRTSLVSRFAGRLVSDWLRTGTEVTAGPLTAVNFPWVLLDRAVGMFCYLHHRTHARRDRVQIESARLRESLESAGIATAQWDPSIRKMCQQYFAAVRKGGSIGEVFPALRSLLRAELERISRRPFHYESAS